MVVAILFLTSLFLLTGAPAAATLVLANVSFSPVLPLAPGSVQYTTSSITIIPSGATTFSRYHSLQMQTGLVDARWDIQVVVDGVPAAQQPASGATAFVNGYLLSYPTTSDLAFTVTINGTVPAGAGTTVTVLQVTELDNGGAPVPGSSITVTAPLHSAPPGTPGKPPVPAAPLSSPEPVSSSQGVHMPGFSAGAGIGGAVLGALAWVSVRQQRHT